MPKRLAIVLMLLSALALTGCATGRSSKFACPNPQGVTCMSVLEIYGATNQADEVRGIPPREARRRAKKGLPAGTPVYESERVVATTPSSYRSGLPAVVPARPASGLRVDGDSLTFASTAAPAPVASGFGRDEPFRRPARIMRIYVRPWEDASGDLHMGSYLYTEIESRSWSVARAVEPASDQVFRLLEPPAPPAPAGGVPASGATGSTAPLAVQPQ